MDRKSRFAWTQLKVGIFVIIALVIAAVGILSIGNVSVFAPKTKVKTYLAGVSGLKDGDLVLLQGVEVGNVSEVKIAKDTPPTDVNRSAEQSIKENTQKIEIMQTRLLTRRDQLNAMRNEYEKLLRADPQRARTMQKDLERAQSITESEMRELDNAKSKLENAKTSLQNIEVTMVIGKKYEGWIQKDSSVSLGSVGLLGDKTLEISLGRTNIPPDRDKNGVIVIAGSKVTDIRQIMTGVDDIIANFGTLSNRLENIMAKFDEGQGTIGKFINDPAFYDNLNTTVLSAQRTIGTADNLIGSIQQGQGTLGKFINDSQVYDSVAATADKIEALVDRVNSKEGSLGKFVNDTGIYDKADAAIARVNQIAERIERGEGNLGKLYKDEALYQNVRDSMQKVNAMLEDVNQGKGTLGKLAKDQQVYDNLNQASSEIVKLLYDFRKNPKKYLTIKFQIF